MSKPARPEYMHVPTPTIPGVLNGGEIAVSQSTVAKPTESTRPEPSVRDTSDALCEAAGKIFQALEAQIAYHENALKRLRGALAPFATAMRQTAAPESPGVGDDNLLAQVLSIARNLPGSGEGNQ
jgi:hypothetical protein